jgi:hypothetical protein
MKKSTFVSYFFFVVAILLEVFSQRQTVSDLRLFVGVFVVLGIAFLIYSIQEAIETKGFLIFNRGTISKDAQVRAKDDEYVLDAKHPYLWIANSIYLDWDNESKFKQIRNGVFAALGGQRLSTQDDIFIVFELENDVYFTSDKVNALMESGVLRVVNKGPAYRYYSKVSIYSMIITVLLIILAVVSLLVYMAIQMF